MVDFHSHVLPGIDDGSRSIDMSLSMLRASKEQGISTMFATPHFYADESNPDMFLYERNNAYAKLTEAIAQNPGEYPDIQLGAEVLFFPGMSVSDELYELRMGNTNSLLIEPPMRAWTNAMLDEIEQTGRNLGCIPVIAHIDRYMRYLRDNSLIDRVRDRRVLVQVNASFFINEGSRSFALRLLSENRIHFIGSDCHNVEDRIQNIGQAKEIVDSFGCGEYLERMNQRVNYFIGKTDE